MQLLSVLHQSNSMWKKCSIKMRFIHRGARNALKCLQILFASTFPSFLEINQKRILEFLNFTKPNYYTKCDLFELYRPILLCLSENNKTDVLFCFEFSETEIPSSNVFWGADLGEWIWFVQLLGIHLLLYQIFIKLNAWINFFKQGEEYCKFMKS